MTLSVNMFGCSIGVETGSRCGVLGALTFLVAVGCGPDQIPPTEQATGSILPDGTDTQMSVDDDNNDATGNGVLDVGGPAATEGQAETKGDAACQYVDVVLAVDNSISMQEEIEALRGPVFDAFPDTLLAVGDGLLNFRFAVIDACNQPAALHDWGNGGACNFSTGSNYMVSNSGALSDEYACVTDLSASGYQGMPDICTGDNDDEQPANTAGDALVAAANAGFSRNEAVLLVVAITDEDEQPLPAATAQEIADKIIDAKGSIDNVVFLGIGGKSICSGPYGTAEDANVLQEVTAVFENAGRGIFWDLCDGSLEQAFAEAINLVDTACNDFVPPS